MRKGKGKGKGKDKRKSKDKDNRDGGPGIPGHWALPVAAAVNGVGTGMYIPFTLVFFHYVTGLSFTLVGAVLTVTGLVGIGALPLAGAAVDRCGARRVQYVLYGVRVVGFALYPFAHSLTAFAGVALVTAAADRAFPAVQSSLIGEVARGADRDRLQAATRALQNGGNGAGALLATLVIAFAGSAGYTYAAWGNALSFACAALLLRPLRPLRPRRAPDGTKTRGAAAGAGYRLVLADRPFLVVTGANFLNALSYSALSVLFPLFIVEWLHGPAVLTGAAFTVNTVLCAAAGMFVGGRVRRAGARRTRAAALGGGLFAVAFLAQIVLGTLRPASGPVLGAALVAVVVVYTLGELIHSPAAEVLAVSAAPEAVRGRYLAAYQMSWSLAKAVAPSLFTVLLAVDGRLPWAVLVLTSAVAATLLVRVERRLPAEAVRPTPPTVTHTAPPAPVTTPLSLPHASLGRDRP
ncbi:Major Facilitator Superfamily protein [Streptomyces sp. yr375]|uniref:MFS transporter n=1 Tax=Streptomyces sp. yr375 TaxID=1761906 RepID=UPI0008C8DDB8|nr:MFS transporter [Streptomyces sp. yr375]SER82704.1 Major Facilitator Superfamily protein [Streptomyces sp. yr375]